MLGPVSLNRCLNQPIIIELNPALNIAFTQSTSKETTFGSNVVLRLKKGKKQFRNCK